MQLLSNASARFRWQGQSWARLYGFLISQYENASPTDSRPTPMPLLDHRPEPQVGSGPKSLSAIQACLSAVHAANDLPQEVGSRTKGLADTDWISIGEFRRETVADYVAAQLARAGIQHRLDCCSRKQAVLSVRFADRHVAKRFVDEAMERNNSRLRRAGRKSALQPIETMVMTWVLLGLLTFALMAIGLQYSPSREQAICIVLAGTAVVLWGTFRKSWK